MAANEQILDCFLAFCEADKNVYSMLSSLAEINELNGCSIRFKKVKKGIRIVCSAGEGSAELLLKPRKPDERYAVWVNRCRKEDDPIEQAKRNLRLIKDIAEEIGATPIWLEGEEDPAGNEKTE